MKVEKSCLFFYFLEECTILLEFVLTTAFFEEEVVEVPLRMLAMSRTC